MAALVANVYVNGQWYGPSYPNAGDPPQGSVTNPAAFADGKAPKQASAGARGVSDTEAPASPNREPREGEITRTAQDAEGVQREGGSVRGRRGTTGRTR